MLLVLVVAFGSACNELPAEPIDVHNQSDQPITIVAITGTGDVPYMEMILPTDHGINAGCIERDLEARFTDGRVIATRTGPFCEGDPVWVITQAQADAASDSLSLPPTVPAPGDVDAVLGAFERMPEEIAGAPLVTGAEGQAIYNSGAADWGIEVVEIKDAYGKGTTVEQAIDLVASTTQRTAAPPGFGVSAVRLTGSVWWRGAGWTEI